MFFIYFCAFVFATAFVDPCMIATPPLFILCLLKSVRCIERYTVQFDVFHNVQALLLPMLLVAASDVVTCNAAAVVAAIQMQCLYHMARLVRVLNFEDGTLHAIALSSIVLAWMDAGYGLVTALAIVVLDTAVYFARPPCLVTFRMN